MIKKTFQRNVYKKIFNIFALIFLAWFAIEIVKDGLEADREARIVRGILWLVIGVFFFLLACIKPLMKWIYKKQPHWMDALESYEEFEKRNKANLTTGFAVFLVYLILALFYK